VDLDVVVDVVVVLMKEMHATPALQGFQSERGIMASIGALERERGVI